MKDFAHHYDLSCTTCLPGSHEDASGKDLEFVGGENFMALHDPFCMEHLMGSLVRLNLIIDTGKMTTKKCEYYDRIERQKYVQGYKHIYKINLQSHNYVMKTI
jgi:hypothetical protein